MEETSKPPKRKRLGDRLINAGLITPAQLSLALVEQKRHGGYLGDTLEALGFVTQQALSRALADETNSSYVDLESIDIPPEVIRMIPMEFARKHVLIPFEEKDGILKVAMADTFDVPTVDLVEQMTNLRVEVVASSKPEIEEAIEEQYAHAETTEELIESALQAIVTHEPQEAGTQTPLVRLVDRIIAQATRKDATDIHIEPAENSINIRFRIDGYLYQEMLLPKALLSAVIARIKIVSNLDVTEHRLPQDGRILMHAAGRKLNLRVSTLPTHYGESVVIRVLNSSGGIIRLYRIGMAEHDLQNMYKAINNPYGIILVTGPTGSGKTTTLYSALQEVDSLNQSVFTLEDPIEYTMPTLRQVQVQPEIGLTFAAGLRALLRQDPDILLVGEVRDEETAELATRAALTGHLVLTTLHTNTAIGAIPRLINMGTEPYLLASALQLVVAQRLVRRICPKCKVPDESAKALTPSLGISPDVPFYKGSGCDNCYDTGYTGRIAIFETLVMTDELRESLKPGVQESDIEAIVKRDGMRFMLDDGIEKAKNGVVSLRDVVRVAR